MGREILRRLLANDSHVSRLAQLELRRFLTTIQWIRILTVSLLAGALKANVGLTCRSAGAVGRKRAQLLGAGV